MKINELLKEIRISKGYSLDVMGEKIGFSKGYLHNVEIGARPVSKKLFSSIFEKFPEYKNQLLESYTKDKLPENLDFKLNNSNVKMNYHKIKVNKFLSGGNGRVDISKPEEMEFMLTSSVYKEILEKGYAFQIEGEYLKPYFLENEVIVFIKEEFKNWYELDERLILVEIKNELFIGRLNFEEGIPYLYCFNNKLFPKQELKEDVKYIGRAKIRLNQDLEDFRF